VRGSLGVLTRQLSSGRFILCAHPGLAEPELLRRGNQFPYGW